MGIKSKFSKETKIKACEDYRKGSNSFGNISKSLGCDEKTIRQWYMTYRNYGSSAFNVSYTNRSYSKGFKMSVIASYLSGDYSINELSSKHNISTSVVRQWINKYNNGIEIKDYDPKGEIYTMKSRKTTFEERLEIVQWVISNDMSYTDAANKFSINYALVYKWTKAYLNDGIEAIKYKKRGPKSKTILDESSLGEIERLKLELERERSLRKRREFELEVIKKKEEFEMKNHYRK